MYCYFFNDIFSLYSLGSNSVNVFLGLGLPWLIKSIYSKTKGYPLVMKDENLFFAVVVFMVCGLSCIAILIIRRAVSNLCFSSRGEEVMIELFLKLVFGHITASCFYTVKPV